jgi:hypothetical protein
MQENKGSSLGQVFLTPIDDLGKSFKYFRSIYCSGEQGQEFEKHMRESH